MSLAGNVSRHDCSISASEEGLSLKLHDDVLCAGAPIIEEGEWTGEQLRAQRAAEIAIINDTLVHGHHDSRWYVDTFTEDSFVIVDCPRASGGICVVSDWRGNYVAVTSFKPGEGYLRDEIFYRTDFAVEVLTRKDEGAPLPLSAFNPDLSKAIALIRQSRAIFDNPETVKKAAEIVNGALSIFIDLLLLPFRYFLYD